MSRPDYIRAYQHYSQCLADGDTRKQAQEAVSKHFSPEILGWMLQAMAAGLPMKEEEKTEYEKQG